MLRQQHHLACPPPNYAVVDTGIVRSAYPTDARHVQYLRSHAHIKTVLQLSLECLCGPVLEAFGAPSHHHHGSNAPATPQPLSSTAQHMSSASPPIAASGGGGSIAIGTSVSEAVPASLMSPPVAAPSTFIPSSIRVLSVYSNSTNHSTIRWSERREGKSLVGEDGNYSSSFVQTALDIMLDESKHPVLICCASGEVETNIVVGCLRRLQLWSLASILCEAETFVRADHSLRQDIAQCISTFKFDIRDFADEAMNLRKLAREGDDHRNLMEREISISLRSALCFGEGVAGVGGGSSSSSSNTASISLNIGSGGPSSSSSSSGAATAIRTAAAKRLQVLGVANDVPTAGSSSSLNAFLGLLATTQGGGGGGGGGGGVTLRGSASYNALSSASAVMSRMSPSNTVSPGLNASVSSGHSFTDGDFILPSTIVPPVSPSAALLHIRKINDSAYQLLPDRMLSAAQQGRALPTASLAPHEHYWTTKNPPAVSSRSTFNKTESIVEEDDD